MGCVEKAIFSERGSVRGKEVLVALRANWFVFVWLSVIRRNISQSIRNRWRKIGLMFQFQNRRELFNQLRDAGEMLGLLLNPLASPSKPLKTILGDESKRLAVPSKIGGGNVEESDLLVEYSFFGGAQGGWRQRTVDANEPMHDQWGETTGDLFINDAVFFRHIPERIWRYELGGYPVVKKWLGYRDRGRRPGVPAIGAGNSSSPRHRAAVVCSSAAVSNSR